MKELHELLDLCLEKELIFQLSTEAESITIFKIVDGEYVFYGYSYYDGELKDYENGNTTKLENLIKKVKEYEKLKTN